MKKSARGFTLIELLVVITIIAFLAIIGLVAFGNAQAQARDGRRRADLDAIATAMEANRDPLAGTYKSCTDTSIYANGVVPVDPINGTYGGDSYVYSTTACATAGRTTYTVCARLEKGNGNYANASCDNPSSGLVAIYYGRKNQQ